MEKYSGLYTYFEVRDFALCNRQRLLATVTVFFKVRPLLSIMPPVRSVLFLIVILAVFGTKTNVCVVHRGRIHGRNWDKSFPPCYSQSLLLTDFTPPPPLSKSGSKLVFNVNIV
jgi:hypothetical protein